MTQNLYDQVFIVCPPDSLGYNVVAYTNELEDEIIKRSILDITAWLDEHFNGRKMYYQFDYNDGKSHVVRGIWKDGSMTEITEDNIYTFEQRVNGKSIQSTHSKKG
jgi:hypothetical protein